MKKFDFEMACCLYLNQKLLFSLYKTSNPQRPMNLLCFYRSVLSTEENRFTSEEAKFSLFLHMRNWGIFPPPCFLGSSVALWHISHSQFPEVMIFGGSRSSLWVVAWPMDSCIFSWLAHKHRYSQPLKSSQLQKSSLRAQQSLQEYCFCKQLCNSGFFFRTFRYCGTTAELRGH